ncbi:hypothetical protein ACH0CP_12690 [Sphingomonas sp. 179-I 2A4 NHS]|uniref:hypothetical protein n=1 Tax=unclassified Sphingomonas TaxID=196159 RepID=UPI003878FB22
MVERGEIDPQRAKRMKDLFDRLEEHFGRTMGPDAAAAEASEETLRQMAAAADLKKRQTLLQAAAQKRARADLEKYRGGSLYAGVRAMMDSDVRAPYENVVRRADRLEFQSQARISDFIQRHRRNFLGKPRDRGGIEDVVRELHGQGTGNPRAKVFADAITETFETLRQRFNAAGGNIGKLRGWGLTHRHDALKVRSVPYDQWRGELRELLDISAMRDPDTGGTMTPQRLEEVIRGAYQSIRSGGLIGDTPDPFIKAGKLANARAYPRVFVFKDGDAWLRYDAKYGAGNVFTAMMAHIRGMSEDIAAMERFGPNPDATVKWMLDSVDRIEAQSEKATPGAVTGTSGGRLQAEQLWRYIKGETYAPVLAEGILERVSFYGLRGIRGTRDLLTAALLGSSPLSAISDFNTQILARKFNGLPQMKVLGSYLRQLNPASAADRKLAIRLELGMRDASRSLLGLSRYVGETHGPSFTSVIADDVLRLSGLNKFTEAGQRAFGLDFLGTLADHRARVFSDLPAGLREGMTRYGLTEAHWNAIRAAEPERMRGAEWVSPRNIADREAADRLMDLVLGETAGAVQENSASATSAILAGTRPGTLAGEFLRNSFQFKGFAVALMMQQAKRMAELGPYRGGAYAAQFFVGMTVFGAASIQLREIAKGRDPRPMDDEGFWIDAMLQGGGLGIFGDLIGSVTGDRVDSIAGFMLGPFYGLVKDTKGAVQKSMDHESKGGVEIQGEPGGAAIPMIKRYLPGGNLWYLRAAFEREVLDRLSEEYDPDYIRQRQRVMQWARDNGQGMWWEPGQRKPQRAPDFGNVVESAPPR